MSQKLNAFRRARWSGRAHGVAVAALSAALLAGCGQSPEEMLASAKSYLEKQDLGAASIQLKNALQENGNLAEARFLLGSIHVTQGDAAGAAAALEAVGRTEETVHERRCRLLVDLGRAADLLHAAVVHQHHAVGHFEGFLLVVRDEHAGHVQFVVQAAQPAAQFFAHFGIQGTKRLIQQQHPGLDRQSPGQRNPLALPTRQLVGIPVLGTVQLHQLQQLMHPLPDQTFVRPSSLGTHPEPESHIVKHRHVAKQRVVLKHEAHPPIADRHVGGVLAMQKNRAGVGLLQARHHAQQTRLA